MAARFICYDKVSNEDFQFEVGRCDRERRNKQRVMLDA